MKYIFSVLIVLLSSLIIGQNYLIEGIDLYNNGKFDKAASNFSAQLFQSKTKQQKSILLYWYSKSVFLNNPSDYSKSIDIINESISLEQNNPDSYYLLAQLQRFAYEQEQYFKQNYNKALQNNIKNTREKAICDYFVNGDKNAPTKYNLDDANSNYFLAVVESSRENTIGAINYLSKAFQNGFKEFEYLKVDFNNVGLNEDFLKTLKEYNIPSYYYKIDSELIKRLIKPQVTIYVERKINNWQKKGKFEKTKDYLSRVNPETREKKIVYYTQQALDSIGISDIKNSSIKNEYDADNESFMITFSGFDPIYVNVPINEAPSFDKTFKNLEFNNFKFTISDETSLSLMQIYITNPENGKTYIYNSQDNIAFQPSLLDFNFDMVDITLESDAKVASRNSTTKVISVGKSDVDTNIPIVNTSEKNTYALIIGNEDYTKFQNNLSSEVNVPFAKRDAEIFAKYVNKTLGVPKDNITLLSDGISSQMNREIDKLSKLAKYSNGESTFIFYFAGHGFPDEMTKEAYIMPVDISGTNVSQGIKLDNLYAKLTEFPSKKVMVFLDACFTGGGRNNGLLAARGVAIKPKAATISGNLVVFSSSSGQQSSLSYDKKQHGMFTYFLLKKLKDTKGDVSLEELKDYVTREVQLNAVKVNDKEQNPTMQVSPMVESVWMDWELR